MVRRLGHRRLFAPGLTELGSAEIAACGKGGSPGIQVALPPGEAHHAVSVLRLRTGGEVELFDGCGRCALGRIAEITRDKVTVSIEEVHTAAERPDPIVHLAFAVPKSKRLDWLLEKATELGAASLGGVVFERSVAGRSQLTLPKRQRWEGHCVAAGKQCGLDFLPVIAPTRNLREALDAAPGAFSLVGDVGGEGAAIAEALSHRRGGQEIQLLVGPEGGLTEQERDMILQAGFVPVRLGRTTLRVETAAVALLAAVIAACDPG